VKLVTITGYGDIFVGSGHRGITCRFCGGGAGAISSGISSV